MLQCRGNPILEHDGTNSINFIFNNKFEGIGSITNMKDLSKSELHVGSESKSLIPQNAEIGMNQDLYSYPDIFTKGTLHEALQGEHSLIPQEMEACVSSQSHIDAHYLMYRSNTDAIYQHNDDENTLCKNNEREPQALEINHGIVADMVVQYPKIGGTPMGLYHDLWHCDSKTEQAPSETVHPGYSYNAKHGTYSCEYQPGMGNFQLETEKNPSKEAHIEAYRGVIPLKSNWSVNHEIDNMALQPNGIIPKSTCQVESVDVDGNKFAGTPGLSIFQEHQPQNPQPANQIFDTEIFGNSEHGIYSHEYSPGMYDRPLESETKYSGEEVDIHTNQGIAASKDTCLVDNSIGHVGLNINKSGHGICHGTEFQSASRLQIFGKMSPKKHQSATQRLEMDGCISLSGWKGKYIDMDVRYRGKRKMNQAKRGRAWSFESHQEKQRQYPEILNTKKDLPFHIAKIPANNGSIEPTGTGFFPLAKPISKHPTIIFPKRNLLNDPYTLLQFIGESNLQHYPQLRKSMEDWLEKFKTCIQKQSQKSEMDEIKSNEVHVLGYHELLWGLLGSLKILDSGLTNKIDIFSLFFEGCNFFRFFFGNWAKNHSNWAKDGLFCCLPQGFSFSKSFGNPTHPIQIVTRQGDLLNVFRAMYSAWLERPSIYKSPHVISNYFHGWLTNVKEFDSFFAQLKRLEKQEATNRFLSTACIHDPFFVQVFHLKISGRKLNTRTRKEVEISRREVLKLLLENGLQNTAENLDIHQIYKSIDIFFKTLDENLQKKIQKAFCEASAANGQSQDISKKKNMMGREFSRAVSDGKCIVTAGIFGLIKFICRAKNTPQSLKPMLQYAWHFLSEKFNLWNSLNISYANIQMLTSGELSYRTEEFDPHIKQSLFPEVMTLKKVFHYKLCLLDTIWGLLITSLRETDNLGYSLGFEIPLFDGTTLIDKLNNFTQRYSI